MGWLVVTVVLGGNHFLRVRLWGNCSLVGRLKISLQFCSEFWSRSVIIVSLVSFIL